MDVISHYQKSIEKSHHDPKRLLHCLDKLDRLSITIKLLEETGVGRTVNSLRKFNGEVGSAAKALISKWKNHVIQSQEGYSQEQDKELETEQKSCEPMKSEQEEGEEEEEDEEERLVIDTSTNLKSSDETLVTHQKHEKKDSEIDVKKRSSHKRERDSKSHHHSSSSSSSHKHKKSSKSHRKDNEQQDEKKVTTTTTTTSNNESKDSRSHRKSEKGSSSSSNSKSTHSSSTSSSRDHHKSVSSSASSSKRKISTSEEGKLPKILRTEGVDSSMGTSFEDALGGMLILPSTSKSSPSKAKKTSDSSSKKPKTETLGLLSPSVKLAPLDPNLTVSIPTISNNYKPAPINPNVMDCIYPSEVKQRRIVTDEEALSHGISSKTMRTKVYSGAKSGMKYQVPSLYNLCIRLLQKNIDNLEYTGGVPFDILKPVLLLASPQQLEIFEEFNPYLLEETDTLWEIHCKKHCRGQRRQEFESWREMYFRFQNEQEHKLQSLTKTIKKSQQEIALPVKKTQLAYVDSMVKAPRNVAKKQEIYGTKHKLISTPAARVATLQSIIPNAAKVGDTRLRVAAGIRDNAQASSTASKPKKAPLMAKMISMMKSRRR